jgi:3'(2'), 5'-bisphosphate nucleotidase
MAMNDDDLAAHLAATAGRMLQQFRTDFVAPTGIDPRVAAMALRDQADAFSQQFLDAELTAERPDDAILSEEAADSSARDSADRVWIIDPLDGTWEYGMNRRDWAVHVALWERDRQGLSIGCVAVPDENLLLSSKYPPALLPAALDRPLRVIASRSRPPAFLDQVCRDLAQRWAALGGPAQAEVVQVGSVGAKVSRLLTGQAEVYLHDSGFYEWDVAAPLAAAQAAGLVATHLDGSEVTFNHRPPYVTNLAVCRPELSEALGQVLR